MKSGASEKEITYMLNAGSQGKVCEAKKKKRKKKKEKMEESVGGKHPKSKTTEPPKAKTLCDPIPR